MPNPAIGPQQTLYFPGNLSSGVIGKWDPANLSGISSSGANPYNVSNTLYAGAWPVPASGTQYNISNTGPSAFVSGHDWQLGSNRFLDLKDSHDAAGGVPMSFYVANKYGIIKGAKWGFTENAPGDYELTAGTIDLGRNTTPGNQTAADVEVAKCRTAFMQALWKNKTYPATGEGTGQVFDSESGQTIRYGPGFPIWNVFRAGAVVGRDAWGQRDGWILMSIAPEGNGGWFEHGLGGCFGPAPVHSITDVMRPVLEGGLLDAVSPDMQPNNVDYVPNVISSNYGRGGGAFTYGPNDESLDFIKAFRAVAIIYRNTSPKYKICWNNALGAQFDGGAPSFTAYLFPGTDVLAGGVCSNNYYPTLGGNVDLGGLDTILTNVNTYQAFGAKVGLAWGVGESGPRTDMNPPNAGSAGQINEARVWYRLQGGFLAAINAQYPPTTLDEMNFGPGQLAFHSWFVPSSGTNSLTYAMLNPSFVQDLGTENNFGNGEVLILDAAKDQYEKSVLDDQERTAFNLFVPSSIGNTNPPTAGSGPLCPAA